MRILYIDVDCLSPRRLGCYGYVRRTSPTIDGIARQGVLFTQCYASDAPCLPSRAALFSGRFGIRNGVTCHEGPGAEFRYAGSGHWHDPDSPMLMRVFQRAGWRTVCFSGFAQRHLAWWFSAGWTDNYGNRLPGGSETAEEVNALVLPWLRQNGQSDNWFMHVHYWDVHTPYRAPDPYIQSAAEQQAPDFPDEEMIQRHYETIYGPRTARDWWSGRTTDWRSRCKNMPDEIRNRADFLQMIDALDGCVSYVDAAIAQLMETLEDLGIRQETAIILSCDHSEAIGELGMYFEHGNATQGVHHLPLIVDWPGLPDGIRSDALLYQLDLCPTLMELLGWPVPKGWDGESFLPALRGEPFKGRDYVVRGCGIYSFQRAILKDNWLLIRTLHPGLYPYDPLYLFDVAEDPYEQRNLVEEYPSRAAELDGILSDWWHRYCSGAGSVRDPFQSMMAMGPDIYCPPAVMVERLRSLGRHDQLRDLARRRPDIGLDASAL